VSENAARLRVEFHRRTGILEKVVDLIKVDGFLQEVSPSKEERVRKDFE
jgi:hypothetical protein